MRTFVVEVRPWRAPGVWRRIEVREDQTLHDLHQAIQSAFQLDDDHPYAFFLNNNAWDTEFECVGPDLEHGRRRAAETELRSLELRRNRRILYLFDFGAELRHEVRVVGEGEVKPGFAYPFVRGGEGSPPKQYEDYGDARDLHDASDGEFRPLPESLAALVGECDACALELDRHDEMVDGWDDEDDGGEESDESDARAEGGEADGPVQAEEAEGPSQELLARSRDVALRILDAVGKDAGLLDRFFEKTKVADESCLHDLPDALSSAGLHGDAAELAVRIAAVRPLAARRLPALLARAGRRDEAFRAIDRGLAEYPDDAVMLANAGAACAVLGNARRAEVLLREALRWAGNRADVRSDAMTDLVNLLRAQGREGDVQALLASERRRLEEQRVERAERLGLIGPKPFRRATPKVGVNEPCPCGSGKKYKKCCMRKQ